MPIAECNELNRSKRYFSSVKCDKQEMTRTYIASSTPHVLVYAATIPPSQAGKFHYNHTFLCGQRMLVDGISCSWSVRGLRVVRARHLNEVRPLQFSTQMFGKTPICGIIYVLSGHFWATCTSVATASQDLVDDEVAKCVVRNHK